MQGRIRAGVVGTRAGVGVQPEPSFIAWGVGGSGGVLAVAGPVREPWGGRGHPAAAERGLGPPGSGRPGVSREPGAQRGVEMPRGYLATAAGRRVGGWPRAHLIAPWGPPAPAGAPPQPHHHRHPGDELWGPGGARGSRETQFSAVCRWPWRLLTGNGSAWSKAHVSGAEFLCLLPSFHGPCLRKAGIGQISSSMPTPGPGEVPTRRALGPESGHPRCLSGRCCDLFLEPGRDTQPRTAPPFGGGDATPRWDLALLPRVLTSPITTSISPLISFPPNFFNLQIF